MFIVYLLWYTTLNVYFYFNMYDHWMQVDRTPSYLNCLCFSLSFAYLGDIPPEVVAEIVQQLRR